VNPDVVVDVGNTRVKWGRCDGARVIEMVALPHDDAAAWDRQADVWRVASGAIWALGGVAPAQGAKLHDWLTQRGFRAIVLDSYRRLPLQVCVEEPDKVGLDRLLNAVAANAARPADRGAIIVDAGTAVTVDYVDVAGRFQGGVIFPGFRLMARALHQHTALLPLVEPKGRLAPPTKNTTAAIQSGISHAVSGGIAFVRAELTKAGPAVTFVTGGDAVLVACPDARVWPEMTLEGIRLSARCTAGLLPGGEASLGKT